MQVRSNLVPCVMLQIDTSTLVLDQTNSMGYGMHACAVAYDNLDVAFSIIRLCCLHAASWCHACNMNPV